MWILSLCPYLAKDRIFQPFQWTRTQKAALLLLLVVITVGVMTPYDFSQQLGPHYRHLCGLLLVRETFGHIIEINQRIVNFPEAGTANFIEYANFGSKAHVKLGYMLHTVGSHYLFDPNQDHSSTHSSGTSDSLFATNIPHACSSLWT